MITPGEEPLALPRRLPGGRLGDRLGDEGRGRQLPPRRRAAARRRFRRRRLLDGAARSARPCRSSPRRSSCDADDQELLAPGRRLLPRDAEGEPRGARVPREARPRASPRSIERFQLGFANRTLGYRLPAKNRKAGAEIRGRLQTLGILRESGHEHFNGSLVIPIFDEEGRVAELYGRKITRRPAHGHAAAPLPARPAPRRLERRGAASQSKEIILCEALHRRADLLVRGLPQRDRELRRRGLHRTTTWRPSRRYGTERVLIAYDRDDAGEQAAEKLAEEAAGRGHRLLPRPVSRRAWTPTSTRCKVQPAAKSLGVLLRKARLARQGQAPPAPSDAGERRDADRAPTQRAEAETPPSRRPSRAADRGAAVVARPRRARRAAEQPRAARRHAEPRAAAGRSPAEVTATRSSSRSAIAATASRGLREEPRASSALQA